MRIDAPLRPHPLRPQLIRSDPDAASFTRFTYVAAVACGLSVANL
jgi:hypothetical protein